MRVRPLQDFVLVKRLEPEHKTITGIVIPDVAAEKSDRGEVIAASAGRMLEDGKLHRLEVKPGDRVLFGKYAGQPLKVEGEELLIMREEDIIGVVQS